MVEDIVPYVGRTGTLTPVAHLRPAKVAGSHGRPGDPPQPRRGAPQGHPDRRPRRAPEGRRRHPGGRPARSRSGGPATERVFEMPVACPVCGTAVVRDEGAVRHYCPNLACPARRAQEFAHFLGRGGMDVEGAGWAVLEQLLERGMVHSRGDVFRLRVEDLETLDRFARKSAENLAAAIERARVGRPFARVLNSLGIPQVGEATAIDLARWLAGRVPPDDVPGAGAGRRARPWFAAAEAELRRVAAEEPDALTEVMGIGPTVAAAIARWFTDEATRDGAARARRRGRRAGAPGPAGRRRARRPAARWPGRPSSSPARSRASAARRPRRQSGPPAASRPARSRRRPTTWSPGRAPAASWRRRRSSACPSSTRTASARCWPVDGPVGRRTPASGEPRPDAMAVLLGRVGRRRGRTVRARLAGHESQGPLARRWPGPGPHRSAIIASHGDPLPRRRRARRPPRPPRSRPRRSWRASRAQLNHILDQYAILARLDTEPSRPRPRRSSWRTSSATTWPRPSLSVDEALANAPERERRPLRRAGDPRRRSRGRRSVAGPAGPSTRLPAHEMAARLRGRRGLRRAS